MQCEFSLPSHLAWQSCAHSERHNPRELCFSTFVHSWVQLGVQVSEQLVSALAWHMLSQSVCSVATQAVSTEVVSQCVSQSLSRTNSQCASPVRKTPPQALSLDSA